MNQYQRRGHYTQKEIALTIYNKLKKYWDDHLNSTSTISSVLDPRYKITLFENNDLAGIINNLQELYSTYSPLNNQTNSKKKLSSRDYFLNLLNQNNYQRMTCDELDRYLNSPVDSGANPLIWWKVHEKDYPILSQMAKDYLSIQATSVHQKEPFQFQV